MSCTDMTESQLSATADMTEEDNTVDYSIENDDSNNIVVKTETREEDCRTQSMPVCLFRCDDCDISYKYYSSYLAHREREHDGDEETMEVKETVKRSSRGRVIKKVIKDDDYLLSDDNDTAGDDDDFIAIKEDDHSEDVTESEPESDFEKRPRNRGRPSKSKKTDAQTTPKRSRGRPRKHPLVRVIPKNPVTEVEEDLEEDDVSQDSSFDPDVSSADEKPAKIGRPKKRKSSQPEKKRCLRRQEEEHDDRKPYIPLPQEAHKKVISLKNPSGGRPFNNILQHRYFDMHLQKQESQDYIKCERCDKKIFAHKTTKGMLKHIALKHTDDQPIDYPILVSDVPLPKQTPRDAYESIKKEIEKKARDDTVDGNLILSYFAVDPEKSDEHVYCLRCKERIVIKGSFYRLKYHYDIHHRQEDDPLSSLKEGLEALTLPFLKSCRERLALPPENHFLDRMPDGEDLYSRRRQTSYVWGWFFLHDNWTEGTKCAQCFECGKKLKYFRGTQSSNLNLKVHLDQHHGLPDPFNSVPPSLRKRYNRNATDKGAPIKHYERYPHLRIKDTCRLCGQEFVDDNELVEHLRRDHFLKEKGIDIKEEEERLAKEKRIRSKNLDPRTFECDICFHSFRPDYNLAIHRKNQHDSETWLSGKLIEPTLPSLSSNPLEKKLPCEICGSMITAAQLSKHILVNHRPEDLSYQCDQCPRAFVSAGHLVWHRRKHRTDISLFVCDICGLASNDFKAFRSHKKGHETKNIKNKECKDCGEKFETNYDLQLHEDKFHIGIMRFQCQFCGRKFWRSDNMRTHIKSQHKDGVRNEALFQENDKKDWTQLGSTTRRHKRIDKPPQNGFIRTLVLDRGYKREDSIESLSKVKAVVNDIEDSKSDISFDSKFKVRNRRVPSTSKRKSTNKTINNPSPRKQTKKEAEAEAENAILQIEEVYGDSESTYSSRNEVVDFTGISESSYQPSYTEIHQEYTVPSMHYRAHGHNTRYNHVNQQPQYTVMTTASPYITVQQQSMLTNLPSSAALTSAHQQLQFVSQPQLQKCKLCQNSFNDVKKHIVDYHKIPLETAIQLLGGSF